MSSGRLVLVDAKSPINRRLIQFPSGISHDNLIAQAAQFLALTDPVFATSDGKLISEQNFSRVVTDNCVLLVSERPLRNKVNYVCAAISMDLDNALIFEMNDLASCFKFKPLSVECDSLSDFYNFLTLRARIVQSQARCFISKGVYTKGYPVVISVLPVDITLIPLTESNFYDMDTNDVIVVFTPSQIISLVLICPTSPEVHNRRILMDKPKACNSFTEAEFKDMIESLIFSLKAERISTIDYHPRSLSALNDGSVIFVAYEIDAVVRINGSVVEINSNTDIPFAIHHPFTEKYEVQLKSVDDGDVLDFLTRIALVGNVEIIKQSQTVVDVNVCGFCSLFPTARGPVVCDMARLHSNQFNVNYFICSDCLLKYIRALNNAVKPVAEPHLDRPDVDNLASFNDDVLIHFPDPLSLACRESTEPAAEYKDEIEQIERHHENNTSDIHLFWIKIINAFVFHNQFSSAAFYDLTQRTSQLAKFTGDNYVSVKQLCKELPKFQALIINLQRYVSRCKIVACELKDIMSCDDTAIERMISLPCDEFNGIYHYYHGDCLGTSIISQVNDRHAPKCQAMRCNGFKNLIDQNVLHSLCCSKHITREIYNKAIDLCAIHGDAIIRYCASCSRAFGLDVLPPTWTCVCGQECCGRCSMIAHADMTCEEAKLENARIVREEFETQLASTLKFPRRCPGCNTLYDFPLNCQHVSCIECKVDFCFLCGVLREPTLQHGVHYHAPNCNFYQPCCDKKCVPAAFNCVNDVMKPKCTECVRMNKLCPIPPEAKVVYAVAAVNEAVRLEKAKNPRAVAEAK